MIVCPVCEHAQQSGHECEVCGKRFAPGAAPVPAVPAMEGLEPTHHAGDAGAFDAVELMAGLEPTRAAPVDAPETPIAEVEPTRAAPVDVDAPAIPDIERVRSEIPGDAPTLLPLAPTCRYCRTPAVPGERLCSRCGMRLPTIDGGLVGEGRAAGVRQCSNCGTVTSLPLCPACGARGSSGVPG